MTLKFYYGTETNSQGNPLYTGQSFTTATECLQLIRDNLIGAGWFVELDDIDPNLILKMKGFDEDQPTTPKDECFIQFYSDAAEQIKCKMYFDDNGTIQESSIKIFNFYDTKDNRLYMTCDSGAGVLLILRSEYNADGLFTDLPDEQPHPSIKSIHFGFLQRITFDDKNAIALGEPDFRLHNCFMQKTYHQSQIWQHIHRTWHMGNGHYDTDSSWGIDGEYNYNNNMWESGFPTHTTTDFITCGFHVDSNGISTRSDKNVAYMMWKGQVNGITGLPLLSRFGYIEGFGTSTVYGTQMVSGGDEAGFPYAYYFRGWVKFVCTGMGSLLPLQQVEEPNGDRWMSTGRAGFQGIRIA